MKLILTGATGFIGGYLLDSLLNNKNITHLLLVIRDSNKLDKKYLKNKKVKVVEVDLIREYMPIVSYYDVLVHLADIIPGKEGAFNFSNNIKITENIIKNIILKKLIKKIIYTSTLDVYGTPEFLPISENHPTKPLTSYGISKLTNETSIMRAAVTAEIDCIILRLSQVYGFGEPLLKVVPIFVDKIIKGEKIILNNNGNTIRDWVYIKDVILAIEKSIYSKSQGVFNIATGQGSSLKTLVKILGKITKKMPKINFKKRNDDPRPIIILNVDKARTYLTFNPQYTLEKGLEDYFADRGDLKKYQSSIKLNDY